MHIALEASKTNGVMSQLEEGLNTYPSKTVTERSPHRGKAATRRDRR